MVLDEIIVFIISKNKLDTLELINEVDLNLHARQIIESSINRNCKILNYLIKFTCTLEDPSRYTTFHLNLTNLFLKL